MVAGHFMLGFLIATASNSTAPWDTCPRSQLFRGLDC